MLTIEPKAGIRLNLDSYHKIHSYQGGGEFWEHQNQQVLMQYLGEFLPRAVENEGGKSGTVLFSHLVAGKDVLSQSSALDANGPQAPAEQLNRLRAAVAALKAKESDALIDPNARKLIQAFRLPDPQKDAELYRITSGSPRRLLVLWGVEKERNSALTPEAAVARMPVAGSSSRKLVLALLLLLLLLGLGWWLWDRSQKKPWPITDTNGAPNPPSGKVALGVPPSGGPIITGGPDVRDATKPSDRTTTISPLPPKTGDQLVTVNDPVRTIPSPVPRDPIRVPTSAEPAANPQPPKNSATTSPPAPTTKPELVTTPPPKDANSVNKTTERPLPPGAPPKLTTPPSDSEKPPAETPPTRPGTATLPPTPPAPMPKDEPGKTPLPPTPTPGDPSGNTPPSPTTPTAPVAPGTGLPDNMKLEITNTRTGAEPRNGKVEVVLAAMGRDEKGAPVIVSAVERWIIAGKVQKDASGKPVTSTTLRVSLTKGVHKCTVEGTDRSGRPVSATADVDVNIKTKTTETPDVTVRPSK